MRKNNTLTKLIQDSIDKGATTAEEIHKSIAELPLKVLQDTDLLRGPAKEVMRVQDQTIGAIYDVIRDVNEKLGRFASELLAEASKPGTGRRGAQPKKRSSVRAAKR